VRALRALARSTGVEPHLMNAVIDANEAQIQRAERMVKAAGAEKVGFVGISFKPGTDDLRESPLAELAARLIADGVKVDIYDPYVYEAYAANNSTAGRGNDVIPDLKDRMVGDLSALLSGSDTILVGNYYKDAIGALEQAAETRPVVDLTRMNRARVSDGNYQGICW
jgi:GDP-mannose 6-dehydrogenase